MTETRRSALAMLAAVGAAPMTLGRAAAETGPGKASVPADRFGRTLEEAMEISARARSELGTYPGMRLQGSEQVAMLVYENMTALDLVGPQYFMAAMIGAKVHLVTREPDLRPLNSDTGFAIVPTTTMEDCPKDLTVLFVPGGIAGTIAAMEDDRTIDFLADRGSRAAYVTSVCTGALVLAKAGLLSGRRATSHWAFRHLLADFGAIPVDQRLVEDGNRITGAGVSSGLDFGLALVAKLRGEPYAKVTQLSAEYAPKPLFNAGTPDGIDPMLGRLNHDLYARGIFRMSKLAPSDR